MLCHNTQHTRGWRIGRLGGPWGDLVGSGVVRRGGRTGVFCSGRSRAAGFSEELTIGFGGSARPCPPGVGSGPRVWSGQGVWVADFLLSFVSGGSFLPGEGSLPSQLTFFPLPVVSARGEGSGNFFVFLFLQPGPLRMRLRKSSNSFLFLHIFLRNFHVFVRRNLSSGNFGFDQGIFFLVIFVNQSPQEQKWIEK